MTWNDMAPPANRCTPLSAPPAPHSASLEDVFSLGVCGFVDDVYDLGRLARASKAMLAEVQTLERTWMRACLETCAGFGGNWFGNTCGKGARIYEDHASWYSAFRAVLACRDELISGKCGTLKGLWGPSMAQHANGESDRCATLKWGDDEVWTRAPTSPPERSLREAWAHLTMQNESLMDGYNVDAQDSVFPVFCTLYKRHAGTSGDFDLPEANEAMPPPTAVAAVTPSADTLAGRTFLINIAGDHHCYHFEDGLESSFVHCKGDSRHGPGLRKRIANPRYDAALRKFTGTLRWEKSEDVYDDRWEVELTFTPGFDSLEDGTIRFMERNGRCRPLPGEPRLKIKVNPSAYQPVADGRSRVRQVDEESKRDAQAQAAIPLKVQGLLKSLILQGGAHLLFADAAKEAQHSTLLRAEKPVSVETMLEAIRHTLLKCCHLSTTPDFGQTEPSNPYFCEDEGTNGDIQNATLCELDFARANCVRLARLESFASLCVGGTGRASLTPAKALQLARDALREAYSKWASNHEENYQLDAEETIEGCLLRLVREEGEFNLAPEALARFEATLALELSAQEESVCKLMGRGTVVLRRDTGHETVATCDICRWGSREDEPTIDDKFPFFYHCAEKDHDVCCECGAEPRWSGLHTNTRTDARIQQVLDGLRAQIKTLAPDTPLTAPAVVPLALSDSDMMPRSLFCNMGNDHEAHLCYACVAEEWVAMVGVKVMAC